MAEVQELKVKISAEDQLSSKMKQAQNELDNFAKSAKNAEKDINFDNASSSADLLTSALGGLKAGLTSLAFAKVAKSVLDFSNACMQASTEVRHLNNLMDFTFGNQANDIKQFAEALGEVYGTSYNTAASNLSQFTQLGQSIGLAKDDATELAKSLVKLGSEYEVAFGQGEQAMSAFEGAIRGNYRSLQSIGIVLNDAKLEAIGLSMGITSQIDSWNEATRAAVVYEAILRETAGVGEIAANDTNSYAVATARLTNEINTFMSGVGAMIEAVITPVINLLAKALGFFNALFGLSNKVGSATKTVAVNTNQVSSNLISAGKAMGATSAGADKLNKGLGGANKSAQQLKRTLMGFDEMNVLSDNGTIGALGGLSGLGDLGGISFDIPDITPITGAFKDIKDAWDGTVKSIALNASTGGVTGFFEGLGEVAGDEVDEFINEFQRFYDVQNYYNEIFKGVWDKLPSDIKAALRQMGINSDEGLAQLVANADAQGVSMEELFGTHWNVIKQVVSNTNTDLWNNSKDWFGKMNEAYKTGNAGLIDQTRLYEATRQRLIDMSNNKEYATKKQFWEFMGQQQSGFFTDMLVDWSTYWKDVQGLNTMNGGNTATLFAAIAADMVNGVTNVAQQGLDSITGALNSMISFANSQFGLNLKGLGKINLKNVYNTASSVVANLSTGLSGLLGDNFWNFNVNANISNSSLNSAVNSNNKNSYYTVGWANR